jgi:hypothetical protein
MGVVRANVTLAPTLANNSLDFKELFQGRTGVLLSILADWSGASYYPGTTNYTPANIGLTIQSRADFRNPQQGTHILSALNNTGGDATIQVGFQSHVQWRNMNADMFYGIEALRYGEFKLTAATNSLGHGSFVNGIRLEGVGEGGTGGIFNHKLAIQIEAYLYE